MRGILLGTSSESLATDAPAAFHRLRRRRFHLCPGRRRKLEARHWRDLRIFKHRFNGGSLHAWKWRATVTSYASFIFFLWSFLIYDGERTPFACHRRRCLCVLNFLHRHLSPICWNSNMWITQVFFIFH